MNLQKAEDEMIKDALHQGVAKILAKYGPLLKGPRKTFDEFLYFILNKTKFFDKNKN